MSRRKELLNRLMKPGLVCLLPLTLLCVPVLFYLFYSGLQESAAAYLIYPLSAYTLFGWTVRIPSVIQRIRTAVLENRLGRRYMTDLAFRARLSLHLSTGVNLTYALLKLWAGIYYRSLWFGAIAVYYLILTIARALLLRSTRQTKPDLRREHQAARLCGFLLLALNAALSVMTVQMVMGGKGYEDPGYLIFAAAGYAFYSVAVSVVNLVRFRRLNSPALSASKELGFATALVSMLSLQTAMFASFGGGYEYQRLMNSLTGGAVCLLIFLLALLMIARANKALRG